MNFPQKHKVYHNTISVGDLDIFYREAGNPADPAILLMHGYPNSSFLYRRLIPFLADHHYHVIAPDFPGFGYSSYPSAATFEYTFQHYSQVLSAFTEQIKLTQFALYLHDYGSVIGMRVALLHPEKITALIFQDSNAYEEGLGKEWDACKVYWDHPTKENREKIGEFLNEEGARRQYLAGIPEDQVPLFTPDTWTLDWVLMNRPGHIDALFSLFEDYKNNRAYFPKFQEFFRNVQPPALVIWGKYDAFYSVAEAPCYKRDMPDAEIHILDAGHKLLESHFEEVAPLILDFLNRKIVSGYHPA
ncbi:alpha/beta fold hydrolase [Chitinophaga solisilvae]|uniref:alpha/beta fold hydrolase n=1 Tax=Chitinophaga solisilvae TaxID=1233460 RepID=UPI00136F131F|nr:alpha/beta hydrolase [Chitinophaga solisilvae]